MVFPLKFPPKGLIPHTLSEEDREAAEAIMREALEAKKRADQYGVLAYLKRSPLVRSKVPNTGFLRNVLIHTVGTNRHHQHDDQDDPGRTRKRKSHGPHSHSHNKRPRKRHEDEEELVEGATMRPTPEGHVADNKGEGAAHAKAAAVGPTRDHFVRRKGRGAFAFDGEGCLIDTLFRDEESIPNLRVPQPVDDSPLHDTQRPGTQTLDYTSSGSEGEHKYSKQKDTKKKHKKEKKKKKKKDRKNKNKTHNSKGSRKRSKHNGKD